MYIYPPENNNYVVQQSQFFIELPGFYGKPWTTEQRRELFVRMNRMGMTTYLYAPKDDSKHRLCWRELYSDDEAGGSVNAQSSLEMLSQFQDGVLFVEQGY